MPQQGKSRVKLCKINISVCVSAAFLYNRFDHGRPLFVCINIWSQIHNSVFYNHFLIKRRKHSKICKNIRKFIGCIQSFQVLTIVIFCLYDPVNIQFIDSFVFFIKCFYYFLFIFVPVDGSTVRIMDIFTGSLDSSASFFSDVLQPVSRQIISRSINILRIVFLICCFFMIPAHLLLALLSYRLYLHRLFRSNM